MQTKT
jgi:hypothetical protein